MPHPERDRMIFVGSALGMAVVIVHVLFGYLTLGLLVAILSKRLLGW